MVIHVANTPPLFFIPDTRVVLLDGSIATVKAYDDAQDVYTLVMDKPEFGTDGWVTAAATEVDYALVEVH